MYSTWYAIIPKGVLICRAFLSSYRFRSSVLCQHHSPSNDLPASVHVLSTEYSLHSPLRFNADVMCEEYRYVYLLYVRSTVFIFVINYIYNMTA
jgi:hypothetical protein